MNYQRSHLPMFQNTVVVMMSVMSIRTVTQLMKYAFNAKITKCHRYNLWKNSIMVSRRAYCICYAYSIEVYSNSSITRFVIQYYWCLQAYIKYHRTIGKKKKSVLQNSLFPVHEEENYSELHEVKSFVKCMQAIMLNGKEN